MYTLFQKAAEKNSRLLSEKALLTISTDSAFRHKASLSVLDPDVLLLVNQVGSANMPRLSFRVL